MDDAERKWLISDAVKLFLISGMEIALLLQQCTDHKNGKKAATKRLVRKCCLVYGVILFVFVALEHRTEVDPRVASVFATISQMTASLIGLSIYCKLAVAIKGPRTAAARADMSRNMDTFGMRWKAVASMCTALMLLFIGAGQAYAMCFLSRKALGKVNESKDKIRRSTLDINRKISLEELDKKIWRAHLRLKRGVLFISFLCLLGSAILIGQAILDIRTTKSLRETGVEGDKTYSLSRDFAYFVGVLVMMFFVWFGWIKCYGKKKMSNAARRMSRRTLYLSRGVAVDAKVGRLRTPRTPSPSSRRNSADLLPERSERPISIRNGRTRQSRASLSSNNTSTRGLSQDAFEIRISKQSMNVML
eukprot:jgi/Bigna1/85678/estExt_fgenesh1_pg.C_50202